MSIDRLLLIAGQGKIPQLIYHAAQKQGIQVVVVGFRFLPCDPALNPQFVLDLFSFISVIRIMQEMNVHHICLSGKIPRSYLFHQDKMGKEVIQFIQALSGLPDKAVLEAVFTELGNKKDLRLVSPMEFLGDCLTPPGTLTSRFPDQPEWDDIFFGIPIARSLADQEIGQTVVLKRH
ncbi:MAG: hypothetical protein NTX88_04180, partial [Candidatus Atribacteria bacterium]|nr:hypothetical protein [Candidatus Atribacteria bacterium]